MSSKPVHGEVCLIQHNKVCQWLVTGPWFSPGTPVYSTNKTDHQDITEILLKVDKMNESHIGILHQMCLSHMYNDAWQYNPK